MRSQFLDGRPLPIFPCQANKRPASPRGFYSASSDPEEIENLWSQWRAPLIGVRTGAASGFAVLDVDRDGLPWFHQHRDRIPKTLTVETPRGGLHLWFQHAEGLRCSISCIARGVDIRADGGYAIFWRAHACAVLCESPVAPWPEWLLGVRRKKEPWAPQHPTGIELSVQIEVPTSLFKKASWRERAFAKAAINNAWQELRSAELGGRNAKLNALAYSMGRLVARNWIEARSVASILEYGSRECGLVADDGIESVRATIQSGLSAGLTRPYHDITQSQIEARDD
jgi:Bifunctional DNA primase/polymerase, N-terminal